MLKSMTSVLFLFFACAAFQASGSCEMVEQQERVYIARGKISQNNWVSSKITVRTLEYGKIDEITFIVTRDTVITHGSGTVPFSEILISDDVRVEYINTLAGLVAIRINIMK